MMTLLGLALIIGGFVMGGSFLVKYNKENYNANKNSCSMIDYEEAELLNR